MNTATKAKDASASGTGFPDIKREAGEKVWFGAVTDAPFHFATFGGATFHKTTSSFVRQKNGDIVEDEQTGFPKKREHVGAVEVFTPARMRRVREDIERYVVSVLELPDRDDGRGGVAEGNRYRSRLFKKDEDGVPANAEPVSKYLFMRPVSERKDYESGEDVPTLTT